MPGSPDTGAREPQACAKALLRMVEGLSDTAKVTLFVRELRILANDVLALAAGVGVPPDEGKSLGSALHKERGDARATAELRAAVLALDEALTDLIGTTDYPDALTTLHGNLRDAALKYDRLAGES